MQNLRHYRPVKSCGTARRRVVAAIVALLCGCATVIALLVQTAEEGAAAVRVDWSEWHGPALDISDRDGEEAKNISDRDGAEEPKSASASAASGFVGGDLRSLVYNCSRGLEIERVLCGHGAVERGDDFRIPRFSGHTPSCGFEVRTREGVCACVLLCSQRTRTIRDSTRVVKIILV